MLAFFKISLRQVLRYYKRYIFLFIVITFGFSVITVMTSYSDGMMKSVGRAAKNHYGGELFVFGSDRERGFLVIDDIDTLENIVSSLDIPVDSLYRRTNYMNKGVLFFNGKSRRLKNIYGVDFDNEYNDFINLDYVDGEVPENNKGIIISKIIASELQVSLKESLTIQVKTRNGQVNTGEFIIEGIINDSSIFGAYRCFMDRVELNRLLDIEDHKYSSLGINLVPGTDTKKSSLELYNGLKGNIELSELITQKIELSQEQEKHWEGVRHFVLSISVYVSQVSDLILAMDYTSYLLYFMISIIIVISVIVSFNILLKNRTRELASMRAIGLEKSGLRSIVLMEAVIVLLFAVIFSLLIISLAYIIIFNVSFDFIPGFEIFLKRGKMVPDIRLSRVISNIAVLICSVIPGAWIPIHRMSGISIAKGLVAR